MSEILLETRALRKRYGGLVATDSVSLAVHRGECHALIGPNGAGKSTLIAQLAGALVPDAGSIHFAGQDITGFSAHRRAASAAGSSATAFAAALRSTGRFTALGSKPPRAPVPPGARNNAFCSLSDAKRHNHGQPDANGMPFMHEDPAAQPEGQRYEQHDAAGNHRNRDPRIGRFLFQWLDASIPCDL